jgi:hypothetical protein
MPPIPSLQHEEASREPKRPSPPLPVSSHVALRGTWWHLYGRITPLSRIAPPIPPTERMAGTGRHDADDALAAHLAAGKAVTEAATAAGVSLLTARRRAATPEFRKAVAELKSEAVGQAVAFLSSDMHKAAEKRSKLIDSVDERTSLAACRSLLEMALKARSAAEMEQ